MKGTIAIQVCDFAYGVKDIDYPDITPYDMWLVTMVLVARLAIVI